MSPSLDEFSCLFPSPITRTFRLGPCLCFEVVCAVPAYQEQNI